MWGGGHANYALAPAYVAQLWPNWLVPLYRLGVHITGTIFFWFAGPIVKTLGKLQSILISMTVTNCLYIYAVILASFISPILMLLTQAGYAISMTADNTIMQENFTPKQRSTMGSIVSLLSSLMTTLSTIFLGWLSDVTSLTWAIAFFLVIRTLIVLPVYGKLYRMEKKI